MPKCEYCGVYRKTEQGVRAHVSQTPACNQKHAARYTVSDSDDDEMSNFPQEGGMYSLDEDSDEEQPGVDPPLDNAAASPDPDTRPEKRHKVTCEEVEDEDDQPDVWESIEFPPEYDAGAYYDECKTEFARMREEREANGQKPWYPFASEEEWELAQWLMTSGISQRKLDKYLKLKAVQSGIKPSFHNKRAFLQYIDCLPKGPQWICQPMEVSGEPDADGNVQTEILDLWYRDPVECVRELLQNPEFKDKQGYIPRWLSRNPDGTNREFSEMWTSEWWWETQKLLPVGSTLCPIIIATDKTQLTRFRGDQQAWPVYLTIGTIEKATRRAKMGCADGYVRQMMLILAAYVADYPEQCLVCCCRENSCPRCLVRPESRGDTSDAPWREPGETLRILREQAQGEKPSEFTEQNLRPIDPFWADFPHCNIFASQTPDKLHELDNGVFGDHVVKWSTEALTGKKPELDARFMAMSPHPSLRHFKKGITLTTQWTGSERKEMEKVFLGILAGATDPGVQRAVRCILDFIYYAHFEVHTEESLELMDAAWAGFHADKSVFVELEIREHFNINKLHKLKHYTDSIRARGTADGYSTEATERLHIDLAKVGYKATNKKAYIRQMTTWLSRQEAVRKFAAYLHWAAPSRTTDDESDEDDEEEDGEEEEGNTSPESAPQPVYSVAKTPAFPRLTAAQIAADFHAPEFIYHLLEFFDSKSIHPSLEPDYTTIFAVYSQVTLSLPAIPAVGRHATRDRIKAVKSQPMQLAHSGTRQAKAGRFDTVLVRVPRKPDDESALNGLRAARIRVIFQAAPPHGFYHEPLAYIDWYTPFNQPVADLDMYKISRSTSNHVQKSEVIPVSQILHSCHLIPAFGRAVNTTWRSDEVLSQASSFYLNPYLRHYDFLFLRYRIQRDAARRAKIEAEKADELRRARIKSMGRAGRWVQ
ncbi:hypothetical protein GGX14DRAFT_373189 [Mycena pura]|uniref:Uncharacterized protein n=1 Tax=Mycena pura TaxID=153505 RepID=A0AAD6V493_9AGAR|nr:hypothetical protein GGX14DRAFT_373189 [Mycena pura]